MAPLCGFVQVSAAPNVTFHPKGIASNAALESKGANFTSISKSMEELGITWLDILKIDIEGNEWDVFLEMLEEGMTLPFTQVLIGTLHLLLFTCPFLVQAASLCLSELCQSM